jgi:hypothetical protein
MATYVIIAIAAWFYPENLDNGDNFCKETSG